MVDAGIWSRRRLLETFVPLGALRRNRDVLPFYSLLLPLENSGHIGPHKGIFKPLGDGYLINASVGGAPELSVCTRVVNL